MIKLHPCLKLGMCALVLLVLFPFSVETFAKQAVATENPKLKIGVGRKTPGGKVKYKGYLKPMLTELFSRADIDYVLVGTPITRNLEEVNLGNLDGTIIPIENVDPRFSDLTTLPKSIMPVEFSGMYTRDDITITSVDDFFKYRLGYLRGWEHAGYLFEGHEQVEVVRTPNVLMNMLLHDRVDVVFYATYPGEYIANNIGIDNLNVSDFYLTVYLYLHLNKRHASLIPILQKHLEAMREDGTFDAILADHGVGR